MNNNTFNEISTNESPAQSPTKNQKLNSTIYQKNQKNNFSNYVSFLSSLNIDSSKNNNLDFPKKAFLNTVSISNKKKEEIRKKRLIRKIIKRKSGEKRALLDFDFVLKELFNKNNSKINVYSVITQFREINKKEYLRKKRKNILKKYLSTSNRKEKVNSKFLCFIIIKKIVAEKIQEKSFTNNLNNTIISDENNNNWNINISKACSSMSIKEESMDRSENKNKSSILKDYKYKELSDDFFLELEEKNIKVSYFL